MKLKNVLDNITECALLIVVFCLPFSKALIEVFSILAIFSWVLRQIVYREIKVSFNSFNLAVIFFMSMNFITVFWSINPEQTLEAFFSKTLEYLFLFFISCDVFKSKKNIKKLVSVILASAIFIGADGVFQYVSGRDFLRGYTLMKSGTLIRGCFFNSNCFAAWEVLLIPIIISLFVAQPFVGQKNRRTFFLAILSFGLLTYCLLLTDCRAAWLALMVAAFIVILYILTGARFKNKGITLTVLVFICCLVFVLIPDEVKDRFLSLGLLRSNKERLRIWKKAVFLLRETHFIGGGVNTFSLLRHKYNSVMEGTEYAHNSYLQMLVETGIAGLISFLTLLSVVYARIVKALQKERDMLLFGVAVGLSVFLFHALFDNHLYSVQLAVLFWMFLGIAYAMSVCIIEE